MSEDLEPAAFILTHNGPPETRLPSEISFDSGWWRGKDHVEPLVRVSEVRRLLDEVAQKHPVRAYRCTGCGSLSPDPDQCGSCMADDVARVEIIDPQKLRRRLESVESSEMSATDGGTE